MRIWKFWDDVNTDEITPGRLNITTDPKELAKVAFAEVRPEFSKEAKPSDLIVGGRNFGCGSSRETAPLALKAIGIKAIIAKSFARIFYRTSVNLGLPVFVSSEIYDMVSDGDEGDVDLERLEFVYRGRSYMLEKPPKLFLEIIKAGGIINYLKKGGPLEI